ncbi:MAG: enoyl-CoA hydratase [Alphaproteobacteria bacterium]|nr:enoyl-CoA hydratase [Alphaproteobacteria bacterium]
MLRLKTEKLSVEKDDGIGWIIFNNPARRNAFSLEMWQGVVEIVGDFANDKDIRVAVMRGAGDKAFASGADISQFDDQRANAEAAERYSAIAEAGCAALAEFDKPLIAMIRGYALGGGLAVAMAADMRIASDDSSFGIPAARLGIPYSLNGLRPLVDLVGPALAKDLLITARRLTAEDALRIGLVNRVVPPERLESTVRDVCATIIDNAPLSIIACKAAVNELVKDPVDRDMGRVDELSRLCYDSADYAEGRRAFMEKRKPVWTGR